MPIGKNSLKRVANNGYSNVKTSAPDMENSTEIKASEEKVFAEEKKEVTEVAKTQKVKSTHKKTTKTEPLKAEKLPEETHYTNIGRGMPVHLL